MGTKRHLITVALVGAVSVAALFSARAAAQSTGGNHQTLGGVWVISPDAQLRGPENQSVPSGQPGGGTGTRGGFGGGGFGGSGGFGGGGGSRSIAGRGDDSAAQREAIATLSRELLNPIRQLTISVKEPTVEIVFDSGRRLTFETTNKKVEGRAANGLVKLTRRARWELDALLTEIDIEDGPTFQQKYEAIGDGSQLRVITTAEGSGSPDDDGKRTATHVYERPAQ